MSALEWESRGAHMPAHRWYRSEINGAELQLSHSPDDDWSVWLSTGDTDFTTGIEGGDLPDAEAQALAVPTLVRALKAVLAKLEQSE